MSLIRRMTGGRRRSNVYYDPFSLEDWNPYEETGSAFMDTRIDWKETPNAHIFKADLPGMKKGEVKMEVKEGRILELSGERRKEAEEESEKWYRVERRSGKFLRRFRLPENVKVEDVNTSMEDGVLTVTLPKIEDMKPEIKSIAISG
ncbi:17.8 kDa class I heat shock protein-like [Benincasa hispida]|uniref:17.8 kDa class I heat shock protein-like n=1 Tax=Benincasa hispida TaxID=102211 RepID=UPI0019011860|nr:17.8 kDa class I heat shock protein-like [Benincasa hispida]